MPAAMSSERDERPAAQVARVRLERESDLLGRQPFRRDRARARPAARCLRGARRASPGIVAPSGGSAAGVAAAWRAGGASSRTASCGPCAPNITTSPSRSTHVVGDPGAVHEGPVRALVVAEDVLAVHHLDLGVLARDVEVELRIEAEIAERVPADREERLGELLALAGARAAHHPQLERHGAECRAVVSEESGGRRARRAARAGAAPRRGRSAAAPGRRRRAARSRRRSP